MHALALLLCLTSVARGIPDTQAEDERRGGLRDLLPDFRTEDAVGVLELAPQLEIGRVRPGEILGGGSGQAIAVGDWTRDGLSAASFQIEKRPVRLC